jgi:hypothetical protein
MQSTRNACEANRGDVRVIFWILNYFPIIEVGIVLKRPALPEFTVAM